MCKASVIVPAYNAEKYIEQTLDSILSQSFSDIEVIVIDDGSTDATAEKVRRLAEIDVRVKYIYQENSGGPAKPRNVGLAVARGEYVFIFDADDIMLPGKLELAIAAMDKYPEAALLFTNFATIDEVGNVLKGNFLDEYETLWSLMPDKNTDVAVIDSVKINPALIKVNFIGTSSVVLRRSQLTEDDKFNELLKNSDDRLFWMLYSMKHSFIFLNRVLHQYRIIPGSISNQGFIRRGPSKIKALEIVMDLVKDEESKTILKKQIAMDYATLAYGYRKKRDCSQQRFFAKKSLYFSYSNKALKLYLISFLVD